MMPLKALFAATLLVSASFAANAHAPKVGHNGGRQADAGAFHVEIKPEGKSLAVYLRDHTDKAVATDGFKGTAILMIEGKAERIPLAPAGENRLSGTANVPLPAEPKGAVQITTPTGSTVQGRFN